jgi:DNA-binding transcriptional MerR regulator
MTDDTRAPEYTVDSLAAAAGTMTTTVRMYQARGLIPPPGKRGRVAVYGSEHLRRLRMIAELQTRGHSLAGIRELLDSAARGTPLTEVLGVDAWGSPRVIAVEPGELAARFAPAAMTAEAIQRAAALGLLTFDDESGGTVQLDERFLRVGSELVAMGVPIDAVLDQWEALADDATRIAARFTEVFETYVWPALDADDAPLSSIADSLARLAPLAQLVTGLALEHALRGRAEAFAQRMSGGIGRR